MDRDQVSAGSDMPSNDEGKSCCKRSQMEATVAVEASRILEATLAADASATGESPCSDVLVKNV